MSSENIVDSEYNCRKWQKGSYDWVICNYRKGIKTALKYYQNEDKLIDNNYISVDFSEIFLYMYNFRKTRYDFRLNDYIFSKDLSRSFTYTVLPPAIFELRRHYNYLRKNNIKFKFKSSFSGTPGKRLKNLFEEIEELDKIDNKATQIQKIKEISGKYKTEIDSILRIDSSASMATEFGSREVIGNGHNRLMDLFNDEVIRKPDNLDLSIEIGEIKSDDKIRQKLLDGLDNQRIKLNKWNNFVDAEHGALTYAINDLILNNNEFMNLYTGSPIPLMIYENRNYLNYFKKDSVKLYLPKCPIYVGTRLFCENQLDKNDFNKIDFLERSFNALSDLQLDQFHSLIREVSSSSGTNELYKYHKKALDFSYFFDVFMSNENFNCFLEEALRFSEAHDSIPSMQEMLIADDIAKIRKLLELVKEKDVFYDKDLFEDRLAKTQQLLYNNSKEIYKLLCKKLADNDISTLSPMMIEFYDKLASEPKEPEVLEKEIMKENKNGS